MFPPVRSSFPPYAPLTPPRSIGTFLGLDIARRSSSPKPPSNFLASTLLSASFALVLFFGAPTTTNGTPSPVGNINAASITTPIPKPPFSPPTLTEPTSKSALTLLKRLKKMDAKFYGTYGCSHCYTQKNLIGECKRHEGCEALRRYELCVTKRVETR